MSALPYVLLSLIILWAMWWCHELRIGAAAKRIKELERRLDELSERVHGMEGDSQ